MTTTAAKSFTFLTRHPAYGSDHAQICLEMVLATAVYEQPVNYVFTGDGVYQLLKGQQPAAIHNKALSANLQALALYGVETVYVDRESLQRRGLSVDDLVIPVALLEAAEVADMIRDADMVFTL